MITRNRNKNLSNQLRKQINFQNNVTEEDDSEMVNNFQRLNDVESVFDDEQPPLRRDVERRKQNGYDENAQSPQHLKPKENKLFKQRPVIPSEQKNNSDRVDNPRKLRKIRKT